MKPVLEIRNGSFFYEENRNGIHDINIKIYPGEKIAVVGNNGAGKSTLFLALNGVKRLQQGQILYHGREVDDRRKCLMELRKQVGIVFQDPDHQIIASTVEGEISFGLFNLGMHKEEVQKTVYDVMEETGLTGFAKRPPHCLSGGEKKRVSIADILVMNPEIMLMDEPAACLDSRHSQRLKEQIERLHHKQISLLISTHDMDFVWEWADRVMVMSEGMIIADDTPLSVFSQDELLRRSGLKKPILYEMAELLQVTDYPRSMKEWKERLKEH